MNEFSLIQKYFLPLAQGHSEALNLKDDAAILRVPKGKELVVTSDTLSAGTHFLLNEKPEFIAHKSLRVNLSDLAAMGVMPYAYQLCIAFPKTPQEKWVKSFCAALLKDQQEFGLFCSGGDTTRINGRLTISITAFGLVPNGRAVKRNGAKPGDALIITGPVGDALAGLKMLQGKIKPAAPRCINAYRQPVPRVAVASLIRRYARAAADISDGLVADAGHIGEASGCMARIELEKVRFSKPIQNLIDKGHLKIADALTGGDDYELVLAAAPKNVRALLRGLRAAGLDPLVIGGFTTGKPGAQVTYKCRPFSLKKSGWTHF